LPLGVAFDRATCFVDRLPGTGVGGDPMLVIVHFAAVHS
jgi:hypothetical protein